MGTVHAEISLKNEADETKARIGVIKEEDIRAVTVTALVDTDSMYLVITEELRQKLGLTIREEKMARTANGQRVLSKITDAVEVRWKNRTTIVQALVIPGAEVVLLGALALEGMDLMVNPVTLELVGVHGDNVECFAM